MLCRSIKRALVTSPGSMLVQWLQKQTVVCNFTCPDIIEESWKTGNKKSQLRLWHRKATLWTLSQIHTSALVPWHTRCGSQGAEASRYAADRNCQHSFLHFSTHVSVYSGTRLGPDWAPPGQNEVLSNWAAIIKMKKMRSEGGENLKGKHWQTGKELCKCASH